MTPNNYVHVIMKHLTEYSFFFLGGYPMHSPCTHTHAHTHTHTHMRARARACTCTHAHMYVHRHTHKHTHTHTHTHIYTNTFMHTESIILLFLGTRSQQTIPPLSAASPNVIVPSKQCSFPFLWKCLSFCSPPTPLPCRKSLLHRGQGGPHPFDLDESLLGSVT